MYYMYYVYLFGHAHQQLRLYCGIGVIFMYSKMHVLLAGSDSDGINGDSLAASIENLHKVSWCMDLFSIGTEQQFLLCTVGYLILLRYQLATISGLQVRCMIFNAIKVCCSMSSGPRSGVYMHINHHNYSMCTCVADYINR